MDALLSSYACSKKSRNENSIMSRIHRSRRQSRRHAPLSLTRIFLGVVLAALCCGGNHVVLVAHAQPLVFATFDDSDTIRNTFGGRYNTFEASPSEASYTLSTATVRGAAGRSLRIVATRASPDEGAPPDDVSGGWCGLWMHLYETDSTMSRPPMVNALESSYAYFSFWIKGAAGRENFQILLRDPSSAAARLYGTVEDFLQSSGGGDGSGGQVSADVWQEVVVPLSPPPFGLDLTQLAGLTFLFHEPGTYTVHVDDLAFKTAFNEVVPETESDEPVGPDVWVLDDFNTGNVNAFGGHFNTFVRSPSSAKLTKSFTDYRGNGGMSLQMTATKTEDVTGEPPSFVGFYVHFYNEFLQTDEGRTYLNAATHSYISFWVKGQKGNEDFLVKLADSDWIRREASFTVGRVGNFLESGAVSTEWQQVVIPLSAVPEIDFSSLGGLTLQFDIPGTYVIFVDDYALTRQDNAPIPLSPVDPPFDPPLDIPTRSMWIWSEELYVDSEEPRNELFDFCDQEGIGRLWMYFPMEPSIGNYVRPDSTSEFESTISHKEKQMKAFHRAAHARGLEVHAMAGDPQLVQERFHFVSLGMIDLVIDYNSRVAVEERFDGVHLDNEPYVLPLWQAVNRRPALLREFVELNVECQRRCTEAGLIYGIAIPPWFNATDDRTDLPLGLTTYNNETKSADYFLADIVDQFVLMNYRDSIYGINSVFRFGLPFLEYAESMGRRKIFMGMETNLPRPSTYWYAPGLPYAEFEERMSGVGLEYSYFAFFEGYRWSAIYDKTYVHVGLRVPDMANGKEKWKFKASFRRLSKLFGASTYDWDTYLDAHRTAKDAACDYFARSQEFVGECKVRRVFRRVKALVTTRIELPSISFEDESYEYFKTELAKAEYEFAQYPAYGGQSIHYYGSAKELYEKSLPDADA